MTWCHVTMLCNIVNHVTLDRVTMWHETKNHVTMLCDIVNHVTLDRMIMWHEIMWSCDMRPSDHVTSSIVSDHSTLPWDYITMRQKISKFILVNLSMRYNKPHQTNFVFLVVQFFHGKTLSGAQWIFDYVQLTTYKWIFLALSFSFLSTI